MKNSKKWLLILAALILCLAGIQYSQPATGSKAASTAGQVLKGQKNWLFYQNEQDGCSIPEYIGGNHYSKAAMKRIKNNLLKMKAAVEKRGAEFVVCIIPSKEVIYPEYMPKKIKRKSTVTRADQLVEYLQKNTNLTIVYPKKEFLEAKKNHQIWYQTDTHWNMKGLFVGVQVLRRELTGDYTDIDDQKFKKKSKKAGDLAKFLGQTSKYCIDTIYGLKGKVKASEKSKKRLYVVGDSFGKRIAELGGRYFKAAKYTGVWQFSLSEATRKSDVVVWEGAERYLDRFGSLHLYDR